MSDQANELRVLVRRCAEPAPSVTPLAMRRIVIFGGKGGVGATTMAVNLAATLVRPKSRNLMIDAAGGAAALLSSMDARYSLSDVLASRKTVAEAIVSYKAGLQVLPGSRHLIPSAEASTWNRVLQQVATLKPSPAYTVIDSGNRPDRNAYNLWQVADTIVVVTTADTAAVMDAYAAIKLLSASKRSTRIGLIVNRTNQPTLARESYNKLALVCRRFLGMELADLGAIPEDEHIQAAAARGELFSLRSPNCPATTRLRMAANWITPHQLLNSGVFTKTA